MNWPAYFLRLCDAVAMKSKDPHTQLGAVIVGPGHEIRSTGYNSFPRGIDDTAPGRCERPEKYLWIEHAERNAIYNAARCGTPLEGCTLYCQVLPCMDCARAIIQAGIFRVVVDGAKVAAYSSNRFSPEFARVRQMLDEAGVALEVIG